MVVATLIDSLSKIGAIGGIVSFVGVGLMILLVASQSRQIRAMREWIDAEPERQAETAQRVIAEVQRRIAAARERRAANVAPSAGPPIPGGPRPIAPAPGTLGATPEARALAAAKGDDVASAPADLPDPFNKSVAPPAAGDTPGEPPVFAPLTPAADAEADEPQAADLDPGLAAPIDAGQDTQPADVLPPEYDPLAAATPAARASDPRFVEDHFALEDEHEDEPRGNRLVFGLGAGALIAGIVLAAVLLFTGGGKDDKASSASPTPAADTADAGDENSPPKQTSTAVDPATVKVVVLNGTTINGLAQKVTDKLSGKGYATSTPNTFSSDSTLATSVVRYRAGRAAEARQVAKDLGIPSSAVQPIDADVSAAAPETANVVVLTGSDLDAGTSTSGTTG